jgi:tripartite-type tricarboxylate transporter receptor subunit TctC
MGQWLWERLGQRVVIDNRPGAGRNIAAEAAVGAPADGATNFVQSSVAAPGDHRPFAA